MTRFDREQLQCLFISVYSKSTAEIEQKKLPYTLVTVAD